ncbi:hypothetical protein HAZT_HAZT012105 [Hyalella azteca]|uniref:Ig-like domain-containing protein n=1 Tax=Hyalella azteca TaxID=294128 RepID=A0A6A0H1T0_HYAAZ|nr:hypothetical protein HAZT_HAZT012105 [Hyalella azteca]
MIFFRFESLANGSLAVRSVQRQDGGLYTCTSTSGTSTTRLLVTSEITAAWCTSGTSTFRLLVTSEIAAAWCTRGTSTIRLLVTSEITAVWCTSGTSTTRLLVTRPPKIEGFRFPSEQTEGSRSQVSCVVTSGDLPLTLTWLLDGRPLHPDPARQLRQLSEYSSVS